AFASSSSEPPQEPTTPACTTALPKIKSKYLKKVPASTKQLVVVVGRSKTSYSSKVYRYEKINNCWVRLSVYNSYNGAKGWADPPWSGGLRSPIGTFSLTDAGGRLRNPGTKMRYHYGPQAYGAGGYAMS